MFDTVQSVHYTPSISAAERRVMRRMEQLSGRKHEKRNSMSNRIRMTLKDRGIK